MTDLEDNRDSHIRSTDKGEEKAEEKYEDNSHNYDSADAHTFPTDVALEEGQYSKKTLPTDYEGYPEAVRQTEDLPTTQGTQQQGCCLRKVKGWLIPMGTILTIALVVAIVVPVTSDKDNDRSSLREPVADNDTPTTTPDPFLSTSSPIIAPFSTPSPSTAATTPTPPPSEPCPVQPDPVPTDSGLAYVQHDIVWGRRIDEGQCQIIDPTIALTCGIRRNSTASLLLLSSDETVTCTQQTQDENQEWRCLTNSSDSDNIFSTGNNPDEAFYNVSILCYGSNPRDLDLQIEILPGSSECSTQGLRPRNQYSSFVTVQQPTCPSDHNTENSFSCSANADFQVDDDDVEFCALTSQCQVLFGFSTCTADFGGISLQSNVNPAVCTRPLALDGQLGQKCAADATCSSGICANGLCRAGPGCKGMDCEADHHCRESLSCSSTFDNDEDGICIVAPPVANRTDAPTSTPPAAPTTTAPPTPVPPLSTTNATLAPCPTRPPDPTEPGSATESLWHVRHEITWGGRTESGNCNPVLHTLGLSCNGGQALVIVPESNTSAPVCQPQPSDSTWDFECQQTNNTTEDETSQVSLICYGTNATALDATMEVLSGTNGCTARVFGGLNRYWSLVTSSTECGGQLQFNNSCTGTVDTVDGQEFCTTQDDCFVLFGFSACTVEYGGALLTTEVDALTCPEGFSVSRIAGEACVSDVMCDSGVCVDGICRTGPGCAGMDCETDSHCRDSLACVQGFCV